MLHNTESNVADSLLLRTELSVVMRVHDYKGTGPTVGSAADDGLG
jgi:hypothetical protein